MPQARQEALREACGQIPAHEVVGENRAGKQGRRGGENPDCLGHGARGVKSDR
jgi:hypothetical protein